MHFIVDHHPSIPEIMASFVEMTECNGGCISIVGSGPETMGSDMRSAVAGISLDEPLSFYRDSRD